MLTEQTDLTQLGPFHEAITWLIRTASPEQMNVLRMLLKTTQVQKGHDGIIIAWERRRAELAEEYGLFDFDCLGDVANDLLAQKQAAEADPLSDFLNHTGAHAPVASKPAAADDGLWSGLKVAPIDAAKCARLSA